MFFRNTAGNAIIKCVGNDIVLPSSVGIGAAPSSIDAGQISLDAQGRVRVGRDGGTALQLNRTSSVGEVANFYYNGSQRGSIEVTDNGVALSGGSSASEHLTIDGSGNVGIGTDTPDAKLELSDPTSPVYMYQTRGTVQQIMGPNGIATSSTGQVGTRSDHGFRIVTNNLPRMTIDSSGNVGIGTTAGGSSSKLTVADSNTSVGLEVIPDATNNRMTLLSYDRGASAYKTFNIHADDFTFKNDGVTESFRIDISGNVLIGAPTPLSSEKLSVQTASGTAAAFRVNQPASTNVHTIFYNSTGVAAKIDRAGLYTQVSDRSLKHDIKDSTLGLAEVLNIPVRSFKWNGSDDYVAAGFIAQELEQALPSAVSTDDESGLKGRSDANLTPVLVKAMQEQQAMIETLQAEVAALKGA
jgi:hypothetical protein